MSKNDKLEDKKTLQTLAKEFHGMITQKEELRTSLENFLNNTIDELTLGIIFDLHRKYKTNAYEVDEDVERDDDADEDGEDADIFAPDLKKTQKSFCSFCNGLMVPTRFASHLQGCMGIRSNRFRNATRNSANCTNKDISAPFGCVPSDNEDDVSWSNRGKKKKKTNSNCNKKSKGGTPKKSNSLKVSESPLIEAGKDDLFIEMSEFIHDNSNSSSPAESVSSTQSNNSSKKKEKNK